MHYYVFEQSGGVQVLRAESPQAGWVRLDDDSAASLFLAINENLPVRVIDGRVEVDATPPPSPGHTWDWVVRKWVDARDAATAWVAVRAERDALLKATDWTQLPDVPPSTRALWTDYRQALRDVPEQSDPFSVVWPVAPG